jgi:hypothetical protein
VQKKAIIVLLTLAFSLSSIQKGFAQKDSLLLICPLESAKIIPPSKNAVQWNVPDMCAVIESNNMDTIAKACHEGKITNVQLNDEGTWDVVFYYQNYYFWYTGVTKCLVRRNDVVKAGQPIGLLPKNGRLELLLFEFETPLDVTKYLSCKK